MAMALLSTMNEKATAYNNFTQQEQRQQREHLKSKSAKSNRAQWKEKLRSDCLARAQIARREKLQQARRRSSGGIGAAAAASSTIASGSLCNINPDVTSRRESLVVNKREREHDNNNNDDYEQMVDHIPMDYYNDVQELQKMNSSGVSNRNTLDTAKMLVEHELQRALTGLRHCDQMAQGAPSCKKSYHGSLEEEEAIDEEEYKISQEEFAALLADVTEELQREEELLEEEMWEMERAEALERERLLHQIDDYDDWEELQQQQQKQQQQQQSMNNVYTSPLLTNSTSRVNCPICHSASLMETPFEGIQCTNATPEKQCTFSLDIAHEGLTLNHLEDQLRTVYDEHSSVCTKGILQFRVDSRGGMTMLMASCDMCQADVVVL